MKYLKLFEGFSDFMASQGHTLASFYKKELNQFTLEQTVLDKLAEFEQLLNSVFDRSGKWSWNRESRDFRKGHFSLNVKVYSWPSEEEVQAAVPEVGEIDDEWLMDHWYRFIEDQREIWQHDLEYEYTWIEQTGFGGKSGGWLVIVPNVNVDEYLEQVEEIIQNYLDERDFLDEEERAHIKSVIDSPDWQRLSRLGLAGDSEDILVITGGIKNIIDTIDGYTREIYSMEKDLVAIQAQAKQFAANAKEYFLDEIRSKYEE